jgi:hypothetical protein
VPHRDRHLVAATLSIAVVAIFAPNPATGATTLADPFDYNGDGYTDLTIGVPEEVVGDIPYAGVVQVLYGSANGTTAAGDQVWTQDSPGVIGITELGDHFGREVESADFNRDGYADMAVGVFGEDVDATHHGAVNVLYGSAAGLTSTGDRRFTATLEQCFFGGTLAAGDFEGDGYPDLAISGGPCGGEWWHEAGNDDGTAFVHVLRGGSAGLSSSPTLIQLPTPPASDGPGSIEDMVAGDFDGDTHDDLSIGLVGWMGEDDSRTGTVGGATDVIYGSTSGLDPTRLETWSKASAGIAGEPHEGESFGSVLTAGDFNADGRDDLAASIQLEDAGAVIEAGAVQVIYGAPGGLTSSGTQVWHQDVSGVPGANEARDWFGAALATGDFDGNGVRDLAIGAPGESVGDVARAGAVTVLMGAPSGLTSQGSRVWSQNSAGIPDVSQRKDQFGSALTSGNFGRSRKDDLAIGVWSENIGGVTDAGIVHVVYGSTGGLTSTGTQLWWQNSPGVKGTAERSDAFGIVLAP